MKRFICAVLSGFMAFSSVAFASVTENVLHNNTNGSISVTGNIENGKPYEDVSITVMKMGVKTDVLKSLTDDEYFNQVYYAEQKKSDKDGNFKFDFKISNEATGFYEYLVKGKNSGTAVFGKIICVKESDLLDFIGRINQSSSKDEIAVLFGGEDSNCFYALALGLTDDNFYKYDVEKSYTNIYETAKEAPFANSKKEDIDTFVGRIKLCAMINSLTLGEATEIKDFWTYIPLSESYKRVYDSMLSESLRNEAFKNLKDKPINSLGDLGRELSINLCEALIKNVKGYGDVYYILENLSDTAERSFENISDKDGFSVLLAKKAPFSSIESFKEKYDEVLKEFKTVKPGASGGGGGGGASFREPVKTDNTNPQKIYSDNRPNEIFTDLEDALWAKDYIYDLLSKGVISGESATSFAPNNNIKREEFAKMAVNAFCKDKSDEESDFSDVEKDMWYAPFVRIAVKNGLINGYSKDRFGVGDCITREDAAVILFRAAKLEKTDKKAKFKDSSDISDYATDAVLKLKDMGIINGYSNGRFEPKGYLTRAECAKMLSALLKTMAEDE